MNSEIGIKWISPKELKPHPRNRNEHPGDQIERLTKLLNYQGWRLPIIVSSRSGFIVAGHGRLKAAKKLKMNLVPVSYQDFEDDDQEYAFLISDNAISEWATLNLSDINDDLKELDGINFDLDLLGFKDFELDIEKEEDDRDADAIPDVDENEFGVKLGDVWQLGRHRIMCGDSTVNQNTDKVMDGKTIDMVFTDPPYNIDYKGLTGKHKKIKNDKMSEEDFLSFLMSSIPNAEVMYVCCSWKFSNLFKKAMGENGVEPKAMIIWDKVNPAQHLDKYYKQHEIIFYYGPYGGQKTLRGDVWQLKRQKNTLHPTMKPIELISMALEDHDKKNIYDGFLGSGSTLIACEKTGRTCYGIELDPHYCSVIIKRWQDFTGETAVKIDG